MITTVRPIGSFKVLSFLQEQMDAKLPIDTFERVLELATEGCRAIAVFMREVNFCHVLFLM